MNVILVEDPMPATGMIGPMSDLTVFLRARLDDEEAEARAWQRNLDADVPIAGYAMGGLLTPDSVLADVEAKRRIVAFYEDEPMTIRGDHLEPVIRMLAQRYASHPDYDPRWKP